MKRVGLMGCGVVAGYGHIPALREQRDLRLHALYDPNEANLRKQQQAYGVPHAFTDAEAFFASGIEAVSITSPAPCHRQNVLDAVRHGLPVICEKPLAMDAAEAHEMVAAAKRAGIPLYTAFCYRFSPCALKIRELVAAKAIGEVRSLRLIYNWDCHGKYACDASGQQVIQKRREDRMLEGGPMVDCGTHQIDLATFWLHSAVVGVTGRGAWVDDYKAPDHIWLHLEHANGAHTMVEISYSYYFTTRNKRHEFVYELIGTKGAIRYERQVRSFTLDTADGTQALDFHEEKNFAGMYAEWGATLEGRGSSLLTGAEEAMRVTEIAREGTEAAILARQR